MDLFAPLAMSLLIGLLIGTERGWDEREAQSGSRAAGIRTFGLIGLFGGLCGLLSEEFGILLIGLGLLAMTALLLAAHLVELHSDGDRGMTTVVAGLVTFLLGALPLLGYSLLAAAGAVVVAVLLALKELLHSWLARMQAIAWHATLQLLLLALVLIPVLPNQGYGPWQAFNPHEIGWMVVLIAGLSFLGYLAIRLLGARSGLLLTGVFGGLASSTAATLSLARMRRSGAPAASSAAGVLVAGAIMFPRLLLVVFVVHPPMAGAVLLPLAAMGGLMLCGGIWLWWRSADHEATATVTLSNPLQLQAALQFALLLALVLLLAEATRAWADDHWLYLTALLAGVPDVDAISLSLTRMAREGLTLAIASPAVVLAAASNTLSKFLLAAFIGGKPLALKLAPWNALAVGTGLLWVGFSQLNP